MAYGKILTHGQIVMQLDIFSGAAQFKSKFDDCVADLNNNKGSSDSSEKLAKDMSSLKVEDEKDVNDKDSDSKKPDSDTDKTDSKVEEITKPVENGDAS